MGNFDNTEGWHMPHCNTQPNDTAWMRSGARWVLNDPPAEPGLWSEVLPEAETRSSPPSEGSWTAGDLVTALLFVVAVGGFFAGVL